MGVLSCSSVKNDPLIYWGMVGCWPLGQAGQTPSARQRLPPSLSPPRSYAVWQERSSGEISQGTWDSSSILESPPSSRPFTFLTSSCGS